MSESRKNAELFTALQSLSEAIPEMRAGQFIAAIGELCADLHGRGLWDAADAELLEAAWHFQRNFEAASGTSGRPRAEANVARDPSFSVQASS
jgi:hypothetical protein